MVIEKGRAHRNGKELLIITTITTTIITLMEVHTGKTFAQGLRNCLRPRVVCETI